MNNFVIENAQPEDIEAIVKLAEACGLSYWPPDDYLREVDRADSVFLCLRTEGGGIAGFIIGRIIPAADTQYSADAEIFNIAVEPAIQNQGFAGLLMDELLSRCIRKQVHQVWLEVRKSNTKAIGFYSKKGLIASGFRRNFYKQPVEDAVIMTRTLEAISQ